MDILDELRQPHRKEALTQRVKSRQRHPVDDELDNLLNSVLEDNSDLPQVTSFPEKVEELSTFKADDESEADLTQQLREEARKIDQSMSIQRQVVEDTHRENQELLRQHREAQCGHEAERVQWQSHKEKLEGEIQQIKNSLKEGPPIARLTFEAEKKKLDLQAQQIQDHHAENLQKPEVNLPDPGREAARMKKELLRESGKHQEFMAQERQELREQRLANEVVRMDLDRERQRVKQREDQLLEEGQFKADQALRQLEFDKECQGHREKLEQAEKALLVEKLSFQERVSQEKSEMEAGFLLLTQRKKELDDLESRVRQREVELDSEHRSLLEQVAQLQQVSRTLERKGEELADKQSQMGVKEADIHKGLKELDEKHARFIQEQAEIKEARHELEVYRLSNLKMESQKLTMARTASASLLTRLESPQCLGSSQSSSKCGQLTQRGSETLSFEQTRARSEWLKSRLDSLLH